MLVPQDKVIITVALTGAFASKVDNPGLPVTPAEIAEQAYACYNEGAAIVHIHARDETGKPTGRKDVFAEIHERIRAKCNVIIQDSTGGGPNLSLEERMACLEAHPDMASLNMGTLMRNDGPYAGQPWCNPRSDIEAIARRMKELGIKPEMEVYNHAMYREVANLIEKGLVDKPYYVNLVLGMRYQGAVDATWEYLHSLISFVPRRDETFINVTAIGAAQLPLTTIGMVLTGCVRVGLEDNLYYRRGELARDNAQLVQRAVRIARELNKEPVSPDEARRLLGLNPTP